MNDSQSASSDAARRSHACDIQAEYEWDIVKPSTAIINSVAVALNERPQDLEPLYSAIDPDTVNALLTETSGDTLLITFDYCGLDVTVTIAGSITVTA